MVDIYQNPKRLKNLKEFKIINRKIETGKILMELMFKYFPRTMTGKGNDKTFKPPKELWQLYLDWAKRSSDPDNINNWLAELESNPSIYYKDLDLISYKIGYKMFIKGFEKIKERPDDVIREAYGGTYQTFSDGLGKIEAYRKFGNEVLNIISKKWTVEFKRAVRTQQLKGSGIQLEDYIRWSKNRLEKNPNTSQEKLISAFDTQMRMRSLGKWISDVEILYVDLTHLAKQFVFEQSNAIAKILN